MVPIKLPLSFPHYWFSKSSSTCPLLGGLPKCGRSSLSHSLHPYGLTLKNTKWTHLYFQQFQEEKNEATSIRSDIFLQKLLFLFVPVITLIWATVIAQLIHCSSLPTARPTSGLALSLSVLLHWSQSGLSTEQMLLFLHPALTPFCS